MPDLGMPDLGMPDLGMPDLHGVMRLVVLFGRTLYGALLVRKVQGSGAGPRRRAVTWQQRTSALPRELHLAAFVSLLRCLAD